MKALILAGGYGSRLGELTKTIPKPMIKIGNKPVLQHIVDSLYQHRISEIIVKTHYLPEKIMEGIGDRVLYYYEPVLYSHEKTILNLKDWLQGDDFFVINGDTISDINYTEMKLFHLFDGQSNFVTALMDEWRCAGTWIYPSTYFSHQDHPVKRYTPTNLHWFDIGTPERLKAAREHYELGKKRLCP